MKNAWGKHWTFTRNKTYCLRERRQMTWTGIFVICVMYDMITAVFLPMKGERWGRNRIKYSVNPFLSYGVDTLPWLNKWVQGNTIILLHYKSRWLKVSFWIKNLLSIFQIYSSLEARKVWHLSISEHVLNLKHSIQRLH